jgi:hypothetical protein
MGSCSLPAARRCVAGFVDCCMPITHGYEILHACVDGEWTTVATGSCRACPASGGSGGQSDGGTAGEGGDGGLAWFGAGGESGAP